MRRHGFIIALLSVVLRALPARAWTNVDERVAGLVASMTLDEKLSLLNGVGWDWWTLLDGYYVGNTPPIARLGIPSLKMHDAGQGFRTSDVRMVGQVTSWACGLALAATWDVGRVRDWANATAAEFRAKGANVILGPGLNLHRVARGGRNAEYLTGGFVGVPRMGSSGCCTRAHCRSLSLSLALSFSLSRSLSFWFSLSLSFSLSRSISFSLS